MTNLTSAFYIQQQNHGSTYIIKKAFSLSLRTNTSQDPSLTWPPEDKEHLSFMFESPHLVKLALNLQPPTSDKKLSPSIS